MQTLAFKAFKKKLCYGRKFQNTLSDTKCSPLKEEMIIFYFLLSDMMTTVEFLMGTDIRIQT